MRAKWESEDASPVFSFKRLERNETINRNSRKLPNLAIFGQLKTHKEGRW